MNAGLTCPTQLSECGEGGLGSNARYQKARELITTWRKPGGPYDIHHNYNQPAREIKAVANEVTMDQSSVIVMQNDRTIFPLGRYSFLTGSRTQKIRKHQMSYTSPSPQACTTSPSARSYPS